MHACLQGSRLAESRVRATKLGSSRWMLKRKLSMCTRPRLMHGRRPWHRAELTGTRGPMQIPVASADLAIPRKPQSPRYSARMPQCDSRAQYCDEQSVA